jgi:hypothetical protein
VRINEPIAYILLYAALYAAFGVASPFLAKIFRNERLNFPADRFPPSAFSDVFGNVYSQCIELMAGRAAEAMLLDGEPVAPADDLRQARELAMLICTSEEAIETCIAHCDVAASDLLLSYGDVVIVLSTVLRIKRTLDGAEIDDLIADLQVRKALAAGWRRKRWEGVIENAVRLITDY